MNKIEKKDELSAIEELAKLKQEIVKQTPLEPKQDKKSEGITSAKEVQKVAQRLAMEKDLAQKENADKNLEEGFKNAELNKENLATNESLENRHEKVPATKTKTMRIIGQNFTMADLHLPSDAPAATNHNRIKDANAPLNTMLAATGIGGRVFKKLFGFSEADKIPENLA